MAQMKLIDIPDGAYASFNFICRVVVKDGVATIEPIPEYTLTRVRDPKGLSDAITVETRYVSEPDQSAELMERETA